MGDHLIRIFDPPHTPRRVIFRKYGLADHRLDYCKEVTGSGVIGERDDVGRVRTGSVNADDLALIVIGIGRNILIGNHIAVQITRMAPVDFSMQSHGRILVGDVVSVIIVVPYGDLPGLPQYPGLDLDQKVLGFRVKGAGDGRLLRGSNGLSNNLGVSTAVKGIEAPNKATGIFNFRQPHLTVIFPSHHMAATVLTGACTFNS